MDHELPKEFDLIVVGTGMVESVVSAAASRIGKKVLHIDSNNYYGGQWAAHNLETIQHLGKEKFEPKNVDVKVLTGSEKIYEVGNNLFNIENVVCKWHIPEKIVEQSKENVEPVKNTIENSDTTEKTVSFGSVTSTSIEGEVTEQIGDIKIEDSINEKVVLTQELLLKDSRKFNLDLAPKLQFARGDFVELLISSNIARYSEYRSVSRVLTWLNKQLEVVPCSRSDVFANNKVSVIEKRMLMKLLTSMEDDEKEISGYENKTFRQYLKDKKLSQNLIHYVLYAISMSKDDTPCIRGIVSTKRFLNSLGRFGKTPFLFSMYGSGEMTQAFCRLSAVFGAIYALKQPLNGLIFDENDNFMSLLCGQQRISASNIVLGVDKAPEKFVKSINTKYISRAIFITDKSVMESEKENLTLLLYPPENGKNPVVIIEMGTLTGTCPKDLCLVHMTAKQLSSPIEDLKHCAENLFGPYENVEVSYNSTYPKVLWSCFYSLPDTSDVNLKQDVPKNVFLCPGPDTDLDFDGAIKKAKEIFNSLYPDLEFLPRAPDPEEIIIEGYENEETSEGFSKKENETSNTNETKKDCIPKFEDTKCDDSVQMMKTPKDNLSDNNDIQNN